MNYLHDIFLPTDEIFLCGALMFYGFVLGGAIRFAIAWRTRRAS
jgi:hypothetical protein